MKSPRFTQMAIFSGAAITAITLGITRAQQAPSETPADAPSPASVAAPATHARFTPPPERDMPDGGFGEMVRLGEKIFMQTGKYASPYVGNTLNCVNCHLDAGRKADSAPMWAAFAQYPAYRNKTGQVDTLAARIQGCFIYSMNGKIPETDGEVVTALQSYLFWLAKGAPVGTPMEGGGYLKLKKPAQPADYVRGQKVYDQHCALCHGADGQGQRAGDTQVFPPLWGPQSFNWGAGMHRINNAASFIYANMPLGKIGSLTEQEAWDVATFMNSHDRPQDPRFTGSVEETRKLYNDNEFSLYGLTVNGRVLDGNP